MKKRINYYLFCVSASLWFIFLSSTGCSIPNLEKPECTEARDVVKRFYSFHVGNDMKPSVDNLKLRESYLSAGLAKELSNSTETTRDYFTATDNYPKAFRVGGCEVVSSGKTVFEVLLFWRDDTKSEQREIKVETVKENDKWLIHKVASK